MRVRPAHTRCCRTYRLGSKQWCFNGACTVICQTLSVRFAQVGGKIDKETSPNSKLDEHGEVGKKFRSDGEVRVPASVQQSLAASVRFGVLQPDWRLALLFTAGGRQGRREGKLLWRMHHLLQYEQ